MEQMLVGAGILLVGVFFGGFVHSAGVRAGKREEK